jgi:hypothetical protein
MAGVRIAHAKELLERLRELDGELHLSSVLKDDAYEYTMTFSLPLEAVSRTTSKGKATRSPPSLKQSQERSLSSSASDKEATGPLSDAQRESYTRLQRLRTLVSERDGTSPPLVASNAILEQVVRLNPKSTDDLTRVRGIGTQKQQMYGRAIVAVLAGEDPEVAVRYATRASESVSAPRAKKGRTPKVTDISSWLPSTQLLRYYKDTEKAVSPNTRLGRWLALKGYGIADILSGKVQVKGVRPP